MTDLTRKCKKCNRNVPARDVRLQADGTFMCFACSGYNPQPGSTSRSVNAPHAIDHAAPTNTLKQRYQCMKCKYLFFLKEGHIKRCPYCSGTDIEEKQGDAQKLIDMHVNLRDS